MNFSNYVFKTSLAKDLQILFEEQKEGWLGGDVATSISLEKKINNKKLYLWLWGDTLIGKMELNNTKRDFKIMPRNSIGLMNISLDKFSFSNLKFYWRYNSSFPDHGGFFSPNNFKNWFWPINGIVVDNELFIFAYEVFKNGSHNFDFLFVGTTCIHIKNITENPLQWEYTISHITNTNNSFNLLTGITKDSSFIYFIGQWKEINDYAILARINEQNLKNEKWHLIEYWSSKNNWEIFHNNIQFNFLFNKCPSEATIFYNEYMKLWYMVLLDAFTTQIYLRLSSEITGPWSKPIYIYDIPKPWNDTSKIFCYATKSHPELSKKPNEIIVSFMSNTFNVSDLQNFINVYIPQFIRITIIKKN